MTKAYPVFRFSDDIRVSNKKEEKEEKKELPTFTNKTKVVVPKKYHHMIEEISKANEEDGGYWIFTHESYFIGYEDYGVHIGRYDNVKELLMVIRTIEPMDQE